MPTTQRIARLRAKLADLGERQPALAGAADTVSFNDFEDFSERGAPGDKAPSFSDFSNTR